jgi:hypothetical protein
VLSTAAEERRLSDFNPMPIRFRCAYCNQLLGISRRKAGTVVRCPTCAGQVVVPNVEAEGTEAGGDQAAPFVFERSDFEELLNPVEAVQPREKKAAVASAADLPSVISSPSPPPPTWGAAAEAAYDVERLVQPAAPVVEVEAQAPILLLTPARIVIGLVVLLFALGSAFGVGMWLGYQLK